MLSVSAGAFFASLVLQEQLLRDPAHPYTWLPPSPLPLSPRGLPGEEQERRGWEGGAPTLDTLHLAEASSHLRDRDTG